MEGSKNERKQDQGCEYELECKNMSKAQHGRAGQEVGCRKGDSGQSAAAAGHLEHVEQNLQVGICKLRLTQAKLAEVWHYRQGLS